MKPTRLSFLLMPALMAQQVVQASQEINDASRLNETRVFEIIDIKTENDVRVALVKGRVRRDPDTLLAYAKSDVCALVLFFSQAPTPEAEATMRDFTVSLVDQALALGGSFYLPYRLTYSPAQFFKAYPRAKEFAAIKRQVDPEGLFTSQFFHYLFAADTGRAL